MKKWFFAIILISHAAHADNLNYTISGQAGDKAPLESLSPDPSIPNASELNFSLDGGHAAIHDEVIPMALNDAISNHDAAAISPFGLPVIPEAPFILHAPPSDASPHVRWTFKVLDENNREWFARTEQGHLSDSMTWDGRTEDKFILDPNRTYVPLLIFVDHEGSSRTWAGEAAQFLAVRYQEGEQDHFYFGQRIYEKESAQFSQTGQIYLQQIARHFSHHVGGLGLSRRSNWKIDLIEPEKDAYKERSQKRKEEWKRFIEKSLNHPVEPESISVVASTSLESYARITIFKTTSSLRGPMLGEKIDKPRQNDDADKWVRLKNHKDLLVVEMMHDRLFYPGTAYLRDSALPHLSKAIREIKTEAGRVQTWQIRGHEMKTKEKDFKGRTIILRSFKEKTRDAKKDKEEDHKLAALRSKVLFTLLAQERFLSR